MRRQGSARWVHVLCAFFDEQPARTWLAGRTQGLHTRQTEPRQI
jgi:hypothetical protein